MNSYNKKMMLLLSLIYTCFFLTPAYALSALATPYNKIVFFGDSISDNGNIYSVDFGFLPKSPPYFQGRFSNGPVWSDRVAQYFEKNNVDTSNYAYGGLTSILHNPVNGYLPYSLTATMYDYLLRSVLSSKSSTLFIIWVGANDYLPANIKDVDQVTTDVVANIKYVVENLAYYGGLNFLVINLPDLSLSPYSHANGLDTILKQYTALHNQKLALAIDDIKNNYKNVNINLFDSYQLLNTTLADLEATNKQYKTNLKNISNSCWQGGYTLRGNAQPITVESIQAQLDEHINAQLKSPTMVANASQKSLNTRGYAEHIMTNPDLLETYTVSQGVNVKGELLVPCARPEQYTFWDGVHPTATIHKIFAINMIDYIKSHYQYQIDG